MICSTVTEKLDRELFTTSILFTFFQTFPSGLERDVTMVRHIGFSFANICSGAQALVYDSLLESNLMSRRQPLTGIVGSGGRWAYCIARATVATSNLKKKKKNYGNRYDSPSSETQGRSVGPGEKARRNILSTGGKAPGYRLSIIIIIIIIIII